MRGDVWYSTCANNERLGSTTVKAVEQSLGFNVDVEKRDFTAQFTQSQPHTDKVRFVAHQHSNNVSLFQRAFGPERVRKLVTSPVHILVCQSLLFEDNERFVRVLLRLLEKAVEVCDDSLLHTSPQRLPVPPEFEVINQILPEEGISRSLVEEKSQQPRYNAAEHHSYHVDAKTVRHRTDPLLNTAPNLR